MGMSYKDDQKYENNKRREILTNASIFMLQKKMNQSSAIHAAEQLFEEQREALRDPKLSCTDERTIIFFDDNLNHPVFQGDEKQRYAIYCKLCEAEQLSPKVE